MYLKKGYRCSIHKHELKDETFYILSGQVWMEWGGHQRVMYTGEAVRIKPGVYHRFEAIEGPAQILEISTTHREDDSYRKTRSEKVTWFRKHVVDRYRAWRGIDTNG
jgi:N-acetylneuraminate synthase